MEPMPANRTPARGRIAFGLIACVVIAVVARLAADRSGVSVETAIALVIGLVAASSTPLRHAVRAGAGIAARSALRIGVALLGARLTLDRVLDGGAGALIGVVIVVLLGLGLGYAGARLFGVPGRLGALISVGMAICGNSAILAVSPIVRAAERETAYAVSTITTFGLTAVIALPVLGTLLGLSDAQFGTWAGLAVNDTAQVVATGYAYSPPAGDLATIVKLTRNLAIAPVVIGAALLVPAVSASAPGTSGRATRGAAAASTRLAIARAIPWFVVGFVALAAARSAGLLDGALPIGGTVASVLSGLSGWFILIALAGVGLGTDVRAMLRVGFRPFALAAAIWIVLVVVALGFALVSTPAS